MPDQPNPIDELKLDQKRCIEPVFEQKFVWLSPLEKLFHIAGFPWLSQEGKYRRLPSAPSGFLPPAVDELANCTSGGQIRFRTNSSRLSIRVKLTGSGTMDHMAATGQCGIDCYLGEPGDMHYISTTRFDPRKREWEAPLFDWETKRELSVTLNLPLYQGVEELWVGVDPDAELGAAPAYVSSKPVVIYGTSIVQGACASRPGMSYPNILSRLIPVPFINLGFSGSGKGEPEVARTIAGIANPALFVLDYEANVGARQMAETLPAFIRILRDRHPDVPILVLSKIVYPGERYKLSMLLQRMKCKKIQKQTVERLRLEGDAHIHFHDGAALLGSDDADECMVDGVHPSDLGYLRMAKSLEPVIQSLVNVGGQMR